MDDDAADILPVDVAYEGRPHGLTFVVGDKRLQQVTVRNDSTRHRVVVKIQSTSSRKFRVRPGLAVVAPRDSLAVQFQLSPHECDSSECKFLLVIRRVGPKEEEEKEEPHPWSVSGRVTIEATQQQQQRDAADKALWQLAEARHEKTLVLSETIVARIVLEQKDAIAAAPLPTTSENIPTQDSPPGDTVTTAQSEPSLLPTFEKLRIDSLESRARVVVLLMKNQSRLPENQITADEKAALRHLRETSPSNWLVLEGYARRIRVLARQYAQRARAERAVDDRPF